MEHLEISKTPHTPAISLNASTGMLSFIGRSLPENSTAFYKPIFKWLDLYSEHLPAKTEVTFQLDYFNTASAKALFTIIEKLDKLVQNHHSIIIKWRYDIEDEDMNELGKEYQELFKTPILLIAISNE